MKRGAVKFCLVFTLFLLISIGFSPSFVNAEKIYSGWHYSGDSFEADDDVFLVTHYNFYDTTVLLKINDDTIVIREGECKLTATREYCIDEIYRDIAVSDEDDHIKFKDGTAYAGIFILINSRGPDIKFSRTFSSTTPDLEEVVTVTTTITNEGEEFTDNLIYKERYASGVEIMSFSDGVKSGNTIVYEGKLGPEESKVIKYKFKVNKYGDFSNIAYVNYTYSGMKESVSSSKTIKVVKPYDFDVTLSPKTVETLDQSILVLKITNDIEEDISVEKLTLGIPAYIIFQKVPPELKKSGSFYNWSGIIEANSYKSFSIILKPSKSGTYEFPISLSLVDYDKNVFSENTTVSLKATIKPIESILSISDTSLAEGSNFRLAFSLKNPNTRIGFTNIKAVITSEMFDNISLELDELSYGQTKTLYVNEGLIAPFLDEKISFDITAKGTYGTNTYEYFDFLKTIKMSVTPVTDMISVIQSVNKQSVIAGETITVVVKIKNNNQEAVRVSVKDIIPEGTNLEGGKSEEELVFDKAGTQDAYTYNLRIPIDYMDYGKDKLIISTVAEIKAKNYIANKNFSVVVVKPPESVNESVTKPEAAPDSKPEVIKEEKKGFFTKVVESVSDFFRRLFGMKVEEDDSVALEG